MDLLLHGGPILTFDARSSGAAVLVRDGRIAAVGGLKELRAHAPRAEDLDLCGALLLPGFTDTHTHFFELGQAEIIEPLGAADKEGFVFSVIQHFTKNIAGNKPAGTGISISGIFNNRYVFNILKSFGKTD